MLKGLARANPGAFPPEFGQFMQDLEETPEQATAAEVDIEENDPDQQAMERHHEFLRKGKEQNEKSKAMDDAVSSQNKWNNAYDKSQESAAKKAERAQDQANLKALEAKLNATKARGRAQVKDDREADAEAKANTPEAVNRRAAAAQQNETMGVAQQFNQNRADYGGQQHPAFEPAELQQVVAAVGRNRVMNSQLGYTLAQQVDHYMGELEAKMVADFSRGMQQQDRSYQLNGSRY